MLEAFNLTEKTYSYIKGVSMEPGSFNSYTAYRLHKNAFLTQPTAWVLMWCNFSLVFLSWKFSLGSPSMRISKLGYSCIEAKYIRTEQKYNSQLKYYNSCRLTSQISTTSSSSASSQRQFRFVVIYLSCTSQLFMSVTWSVLHSCI